MQLDALAYPISAGRNQMLESLKVAKLLYSVELDMRIDNET